MLYEGNEEKGKGDIMIEDNVIDFMKTLDYSKLDKNIIKENKNLLYKDVSGLNGGYIEKEFKWFQKIG